MKTPLMYRLAGLLRIQRPAAILSALLAALALAGCVTQQQVRRIVHESNAALLASQLGANVDPLRTADESNGTNDLDEASARIDAFITSHPDQKTTEAALRIRQAFLLLQNKRYEMAEAAFAAADPQKLFTTRDRSLQQLGPDLVWWFRNSQGPLNDEKNRMPQVLSNFFKVQTNIQARLPQEPDSVAIRDYVAETRAWIGLKRAKGTADPTKAKAAFEDALQAYASIFGPEDAALLACGCVCSDQPGPKKIPQNVRRCFRTQTLAAYARRIISDKGVAWTGPAAPQVPAVLAPLLK